MTGSRLGRWLLSAMAGTPGARRLMILTFHRVLAAPDPLLPDEPDAVRFEATLSWIRRFLTVLPLPEAADRLRAGTLPPRAVCITFDDGYANNHDVALPLLQRFSLPATFFIATGVAQHGAMWNDLVIEAIRRCGKALDMRPYGLGVHPISSEAERAARLNEILRSMKYLPLEERLAAATDLYTKHCGSRPPELMMSEHMIRALDRAGHDVGAHTVSHPILANLEDARALEEIVNSRDWLARLLGRPPVSFAYPNGRPGIDFDERHRVMVRNAGFRCAVSTQWGCAVRRSDPMALPRFTPWEETRMGFFTRLLKTYAQSYRHGPRGV